MRRPAKGRTRFSRRAASCNNSSPSDSYNSLMRSYSPSPVVPSMHTFGYVQDPSGSSVISSVIVAPRFK